MPLEGILADLKRCPSHIVAVFDEAPVSVRRGGAGFRLPMSPFCVRRQVRFQARLGEMRLEVTSGDPPFYQFMELVKHAEGNDGEGTPYAFTHAEGLRAAVDSVLTPEEFGAHWLFLADRSLPDEGGMRAQRLQRKRDGQREILLAARDYSSLVRLMRPVFESDMPNLLLQSRQMETLLAEGAHLVGGGLLDMVKTQEGRAHSQKVIGLTGSLLAARAYQSDYPQALIVSTDSQLARMWLRLGTQGERCDLLALREHDGKLIVECIEVKTAKGAPRAPGHEKISTAREQLRATLAAVEEGLGDMSQADAEGRHLAAPRNEMLKEVLVQGSMARHATRPRREAWAGWLERLFGRAAEMPELRGLVMDIALGSAEDGSTENLSDDRYTLRLQHITEATVQGLLEGILPARGAGPADEGDSGGSAETPPPPTPKPPPVGPTLARTTPPPPAPPESEPERSEPKPPPPPAPVLPDAGILLGNTSSGEAVHWLPSLKSNPHLMMVGLPGMGKTTSLVSICRQLHGLGIAPIVFSYHDDIDEKLSAALPDLVLADSRNLGFNPMQVVSDDPKAHIEAAGELRDIFAAIFTDLGDLQLSALYEAFKAAYQNVGWGSQATVTETPAFSAFITNLKAMEKPDKGTKTLLARLAELADRDFFNTFTELPSFLDDSRPIVLQLHQSKAEAAQRAFASFAFYRLYQDMFRRGRQERITHAIIFDEAHRAAKLKLIPTMAKECRKYGIALILASQESRDFAPSLFSNIANYLVLRVTDETAKHLAKNVVSSDRQRQVMDKLKQLPKYQALCFGEQYGKMPLVKLVE